MSLTIKQDVDHWYALFSGEVAATPLPPSEAAIGLDLGVLRFATLSDGQEIEHPRWYRTAQATIARLDRLKNRRVKQSQRRKRAAIALAKAQRTGSNQRRDCHHQRSRQVVNASGSLVMPTTCAMR